MSGYIKIDRKITEWEWYKNLNTKVVFFHCLLKANWKDGKFEGKIIKRGSFVTSIKKLSLELFLTEDEVRTAIKHLISTGEITKQTTNKYSVITVSNYELYQDVPEQIPSNSQTDTKQIPNNSHSIPKQFPTIEERKNIRREEGKKERRKEDKKEGTNVPKKKEPAVYYPNDENLNKAFVEFLKMRKTIKKPLETKTGITRAMNRLEKLSGGDNDLSIQILEQSIYHCWQDIYELKSDSRKKQEINVFDEWRNA